MKSPSPEICGDTPLGTAAQVRYLAYGLRQIADSVGERYPTRPLSLDVASVEVSQKIREGASPLRVYTCALAERAIADFGPERGIVADLGCGRGSHRRFFQRAEQCPRYLGIDITPEVGAGVTAGNAGCHFARMSVENLGLATNSLAFTFSSSALEHVEDIDRAIGEIRRAMRPGAYGLHIVPGVWALFLYIFHGYRRFSAPGLARLFENAGFEVVQLWSLGGLASFALHGVWITCLDPIIMWTRRRAQWRRRQPTPSPSRDGRLRRLYSRLLSAAVRVDRHLPFPAIGYAILIRRP